MFPARSAKRLRAIVIVTVGCAACWDAQAGDRTEGLQIWISAQANGSPLVCVRNYGTRSVWLPGEAKACDDRGYRWYGGRVKTDGKWGGDFAYSDPRGVEWKDVVGEWVELAPGGVRSLFGVGRVIGRDFRFQAAEVRFLARDGPLDSVREVTLRWVHDEDGILVQRAPETPVTLWNTVLPQVEVKAVGLRSAVKTIGQRTPGEIAYDDAVVVGLEMGCRSRRP